MKKLMKNKHFYLICIIIMIAIYGVIIFTGGITVGIDINSEETPIECLLIYNILIAIFILMINIIFVIFDKENKLKKIVLGICILLNIFLPIKLEYYSEIFSSTDNILDMILDIILNSENSVDAIIHKIEEYAESSEEFNIEEAIKRDGYITEDSALRIASQTYIQEGERKVSVKEYIKKIGKGSIELIEKDNEKYWSIELNYDGYAYKEEAKIEIDYYTGEVRFNDIVSATYID